MKYLVVGGLAVVFYGISRTTYDVDVSVDLTTDNLDHLAMALKRPFDSRHGLRSWARSGFRPTGANRGATGSARGAPLGFVPRVPAPITDLADAKTRRLWTGRRGMKVYSFIEPSGFPPRNVGVIIEPLRQFKAVYRRRTMATLRGVSVPLIPADELARMKRSAGRPQDLQDLMDLRLAGWWDEALPARVL